MFRIIPEYLSILSVPCTKLTMWALIFIIGIICLIALQKYKSYKTFWKYIMEMPGPKAYPVIGNLRDLMVNSEQLFRGDRERCNKYFPIFKIWSFNESAIGLLNLEDIELVLTNMKHIEKAGMYNFLHNWLGSGLLTSTGAKWQKRRKILTPAFHFTILQEFVDIFNKETSNLVEDLARECHKPYINVVIPITEYTLFSIGETSLGVNLSEDSNSTSYKEAIYKYGHCITERITKPWFYDKNLYRFSSLSTIENKHVKIMQDFSNNIIKRREKVFKIDEKLSYSSRKRLAMLDLLLKAKHDGADIDDEGIREEVDTFMFEGHDTTSMAICYTLMTLANEPKVQEELLREIYEVLGESGNIPAYKDLTEMKYMERCIKECLRLYPSVPFIGRVAGEDIKTHIGYTIPKGANINIYIFDLHRCPQYWEDPETFNPDRFLPDNIAKRHPFQYLPFSAGPRNCIGQKFAILEVKAALCGILRKFKLEAVDRPQDLKFKSDLVLRPLNEVRVKFIPR